MIDLMLTFCRSLRGILLVTVLQEKFTRNNISNLDNNTSARYTRLI